MYQLRTPNALKSRHYVSGGAHLGWLAKFRRRQRRLEDSDKGPKPRARRFPVRLPVRYRCRGERDWRDGATEDISCTGLLFRTSQPLAPRTPVELSFTLPQQIAGTAQVQVSCQGYIVRSAPAGRDSLAAAAVFGYRLLYGDARPEAEIRHALQEESARSLAAGPARELNDQLAVIVGNSEIMLSQPELPEQMRRSLAQSKAAALRAASLVANLLAAQRESA